MLCWSCHKEIGETAKFCPHCEAEVFEAPAEDELKLVQGLLSQMNAELLDELRDAFEKSESGEDFVNRIMIGDCPKCGSSATSDCENDPQIENACIARCTDCGQLWCADCGELFDKNKIIDHDCPAWEDIGDDDD